MRGAVKRRRRSNRCRRPERPARRALRTQCPTFSYPMDCSLPSSSIHGIFQTRVLEWGAIAFSIQDSPAEVWVGGGLLQWWGH